jgi:glycosyltransferase involved in cell wall biosynthesis
MTGNKIIGISVIGKKSSKISRFELINSLQKEGFSVSYLFQDQGDELHSDFKRFDVSYVSIPLQRDNTNIISEVSAMFQIVRVLLEGHYEAMIIFGIRTFPVMVIASKLAGINKIVCIVNGTGRLFLMGGIKGFLVKLVSFPMLWLAFFLANFIFFQNTDDLALIKNKLLLWRQNYGRINGSGVNLETFNIVPLVKTPVFTMICRVTGDKGVNEYIQAAESVKALYPEATFHLIGPMDDDDESVNIKNLSTAVNEGIINYIGPVEDVRPYLLKTRFYVLPSYHEGTPRTVLEAMAMGRPIITTDAPGCRETVINDVNGFLVPIKDAVTLAEKMVWMINHPEEVSKMGEESRRIAEEKYDVHKINLRIISKIHP